MKLQSQKNIENNISDENNKCLFYNNALNNSNSISGYNKNNIVNQK